MPMPVTSRRKSRCRSADRMVRVVSVAAVTSGLRAMVWEQDQIADGRCVGQQHQQAIDADADAAGGWHAVLERQQEVLVERMGLLLARLALGGLELEPGSLLVGVRELAERGGELQPTDH